MHKTHKKIKLEDEVLLALKAVQQTGERFDVTHVADVLVANDTNIYIKSYEHDKLEVYGKGRIEEIFEKFVLPIKRANNNDDENDKEPESVVEKRIKGVEFWVSILRQLVIFGYLEKDIDNYGIIKLSAKGEKYMQDTYPITFSEDHNYDHTESSDDDDISFNSTAAGGGGGAFDAALFELLKALRRKVAKEKNVPPYVVFQDPSLEEMATTYPTNKEEMAQINGVGMGKVVKFGKAFIDLINKYVEDNEIETTKDFVVKSAVNRSKTKIFVIQQIDRKIDFDEIAEAKDLTMTDLIEEVEHICYSGTKLNLDYYINQVIDPDKQQEIYAYFMTSESDNIREALKELKDDEVTEEELRLMRIKFLSEMAN